MKELNIARALTQARHKKGIRQEELAEYIGVSKAAVSKWELDRSYPDITLLPKLASFFNISIDELVGYEPQMEKEDIKKLYHRLSKDFAQKPFQTVLEECDAIIKKYYSCLPLLLQISILLLNNSNLAEDPKEIIQKAADLALRVKTEIEDLHDSKEALLVEVTCYLMMNEPQKALCLQDETIQPLFNETELLAQTYQMTGDINKARRTYQISMYQHVIALTRNTAPYLITFTDNLEKAEEIIRRTLANIELYHLDNLHFNSTLIFYLAAAQIYCTHQRTDPALDMLERYAKICFLLKDKTYLHGDSYFDMVDDWFQCFSLGNNAPRDIVLIQKSMLEAVEQNPNFNILKNCAQYKNILNILTHM